MAPRNNDAGTSFTTKKKNFPTDESESETDIRNVVSSLLHKKHKVIKMVKSQLKKIQEEGLTCDLSLLENSGNAMDDSKQGNNFRRAAENKKSNASERPSRFMSFGVDTVQALPPEGSESLLFENYADARGSRGLSSTKRSQVQTSDMSRTASETKEQSFAAKCCYLLFFLLLLLLLILLIVWISVGPLSNSKPHTPLTTSSFVGTDSLCTLEKKYLLRWSQPQYFE